MKTVLFSIIAVTRTSMKINLIYPLTKLVEYYTENDLLPAFWPGSRLQTSPYYYGVQTISSTQRVVRRVVVTGSSSDWPRSLPSVLSFPFCRKWDFHRY